MTTKKLWSSLMSRSFEPRDWFVMEDGGGARNLTKSEGFNMWVYEETSEGIWTVGFYKPSGEWSAESSYSSAPEAASRVRWLNGGKE